MTDGAVRPMIPVVPQIADPDSHMTMQRIGHCDRDTKPHDAMSQPEGVDVAIAQEEHARDRSPDERKGRENWIGQVRNGEDDRCNYNRKRHSRQQA
jgi:hypothetical protein